MEAEGLLDRAKQIRDEKEDGANTALRVGGLMVDMVKSFGNQSFEILGHYNTLEELKLAFPDGPTQKGLYAVGEKPYSYYAYYDGDWQDQGKLMEELSVYKSSLSFGEIEDGSIVTNDQLIEIAAITNAWKAGKIVYVIDEKGAFYNLGALNIQIADDNTECSFLAFGQNRYLCIFRCKPSIPSSTWNVFPVGNDLFALIEHTHVAGDITEEADRKFMTSEEKSKLKDIDLSQYAKSDLSNAMTVSLGQNGYAKFNNGLLIQWGTRVGATGGAINLYFPTSFYNTDYNIYFTGAVNNTGESFIYAPGYDLNGKYTSYCRVITRGINSTPAIVWTSWNFTWFAIGRWK